jgi:phospholipid N-methyltransferase
MTYPNVMSKKNFFSQFLREGKSIGAVTPSSRFLVKKMVAPIQFENCKCIVEFGSGTGTITQEILKKMRPDTILLAFENNEEFCKILKQFNDPRLKIICDSAEKISYYLKKYEIEKADYIVSSLPIAVIPQNVVDLIIKAATQNLSKNGSYIQFQYSLLAYKRFRKTFRKVRLSFALINIPPAFIFTCTL